LDSYAKDEYDTEKKIIMAERMKILTKRKNTKFYLVLEKNYEKMTLKENNGR
jgi:hypothetical protein